ncbi:flagellar biosynthetic protein FliR [Jatrophihabitans sp. GAS493]|uniref:flagellar biosynthetic protein FliR n=1 Tax=Jatrophihabitans sp. GAS493 TaxID=1907575 RepID=UPI000BB6D3C7|nr:flagellar biosynthetic protein FliR [Jatrophihabitans sp. GAS493]SOD71317.1 flagellar biosynthetic protein FliR [Jatrophihabitans sp. GAS493]
MTVQIATANLLALLLVSLRVLGWTIFAPPLATSGVPRTVQVMLSVAIGLALSPSQVKHVPPVVDAWTIVGIGVEQIFIGVGLGFMCRLVFTAIEAAGGLIDLAGGFSLSFGYDPLMQNQSAVFSRFHALLSSTLIFASSAHLFLLQGFMRTFDTLPLDGTISMPKLSASLIHGVTNMFVGALQIAGPLLVVLFIADLGLGLLNRIAPQLNAFALSFPLKIGLTLSLIGFTFLLLPQVVAHLTTSATDLLRVVTG